MIPEAAVEAWVASAAPDTIIGRLRDERKNMTNQVIPAEAGIAASKAYVTMRNSDRHATPQEYALAMLEAAAPHMQTAPLPYTIEDQRKHGETW